MNKLFLLGITAISIFLLAVPHNAFAQYYNPSGGSGQIEGFGQGLGSILNRWLGGGHIGGYYAGQQDAIYDHNQGLVYNPYPQCCHSELYRHTFQEGYDQQWNTYQQTDQHTNIYVNGNNNYINTAQSSNQGQGQSQPSWTSPDNTNGDCGNECPWGHGP